MAFDPTDGTSSQPVGFAIGSQRRYYLFAYHSAVAQSQGALAGVLLANRAALAGTPVSPTFPAYAALQNAQYTCVEDLTGCDAEELQRHGLSYADSTAVLEALGLPTGFRF